MTRTRLQYNYINFKNKTNILQHSYSKKLTNICCSRLCIQKGVSWMKEGRKCIFVILWEKQFCAQISFVFHCFLTSCFVHKNVNTLSWDLYYDSKCVTLHELSISTTKLISPKMSLTTLLHSYDFEIRCLAMRAMLDHINMIKIVISELAILF